MSRTTEFAPGELIHARGREWIVLSSGSSLRIRPLTGSENEVETIIPALELEPVRAAVFDPPSVERSGPREAAQLLRDALRLTLRRGAGPFRGAGRINFEPRAYQLAPLMMALRQEVVRLLIADDVGIGKTIEASLILRELLDRGEIDRFSVLCPPHLVEQWTQELESKFAIVATPVTASSAARLERDLPNTTSVFDAYPFTVVSLDFIKSQRRMDDFLRACPEMVVVDEAHAAVASGQGRQQRFELLRGLADDTTRHLILLTATPHSGDDIAFHNLLGLLNKDFVNLQSLTGEAHRTLRERLAGHFIQRRRADIQAWKEPGLFPTQEAGEIKYTLTGAYDKFFNDVLDYCAEVVGSETGELRQRLAFWGTLALMRCIGSSPAAAARALRTRIATDADEDEEKQIAARAIDDDEGAEDDLEPGAAIEDARLKSLIQQADALAANPSKDPKFVTLQSVTKELLEEGFSPVIFCRFVATAESLGAALEKAFKGYKVEVVTGSLPSEEREARVEALGEHEKRILVATDCLSEGINLQAYFNAVVHYDLSWNPTRHQQREGRVDRFGQQAKKVRAVLIYGENNPVDGAVLDVILRKAKRIEKETGVQVPLPDEGGSLTKALMTAVILRAKQKAQRLPGKQTMFDFDVGQMQQAKDLELKWINASEKEKKARTIFAQNSLKPEEVAAEWDATFSALGSFSDVERFVSRSMNRLGAALVKKSGGYIAPLHQVPRVLKERFQAEGLIDDVDAKETLRIAFDARPPAGYTSIHRAHALPVALAEMFLENALDSIPKQDDPANLPRCGVWECHDTNEVQLLLLLRIRHRIDSRGRLGPKFAMAEEAAAITFHFETGQRLTDGAAAFSLLEVTSGNVPDRSREIQLNKAKLLLPKIQRSLNEYAAERANTLASDHSRVRQALGSRGAVRVTAVTPPDVIGLYVLMPRI